ncbi:MAG TPA: hypothetical protein VEY06_06320 [Flavisolibacter sp.]|nr:hypothetical protein [Flavisolibacter sp.]
MYEEDFLETHNAGRFLKKSLLRFEMIWIPFVQEFPAGDRRDDDQNGSGS